MLAIGLPYGFRKSTWKEIIGMLGWMILFAVLVMVSVLRLLTGHAGDASARIASLLFAVLFLAGVLTRAARGRAW
jgi:hypothetical protein